MFEENNGNGVKFKSLDTCGGIALIGGSEIEFILETSAYFGLEKGEISVYMTEEDTFGVTVPNEPRLDIQLKAAYYSGAEAKIRKTLLAAYDLYQKQINEKKDKENNI